MSQGAIFTKGKLSDKYALNDQVLGKGSFAKVQLGTRKDTGEKVAIKILNTKKMKKSDVKKVDKEVAILASLAHRNVVRVYDAYADRKAGIYHIVMEFAAKGDLFEKIVNEDRQFHEGEASEIVRTVMQALKYCKDKGVIHRDIKPDNILITETGTLKIADFNLSKMLSLHEIEFSVIETQCGTPNYVAPEVLSGKSYDYKCDIWSVGVIMFLMLSGGYLPFFPDDEHAADARDQLLARVRGGKWSFEPEESWIVVSDSAKDLLKKILVRKPAARLNYEQVLAHPWLNTSANTVDRIENVINTSSMLSLKKKVDKARMDKLRSTGTAHLALQTLADLMNSQSLAAFPDSLDQDDI